MPPFRRTAAAFRTAADALAIEIRDSRLNLVLTILAAMFAAYVVLGLKTVATGPDGYRFGDFYALWSSAVIAHQGDPALNYDADALHLRQVAMGMHANAFNPFPYPPTFLMILAPLGALGLGAAYALFMSATLAGYVWAMVGGRRKDWPRLVGALIAPATGIALISGQSGFLSGALMVGGLRLAPTRPILAGVLFGLLAYKPQLGVLVPLALIAAGMWRAIFAAGATLLVCAAASSAAFGMDIWPTWLRSLLAYSGHFNPIDHLMPTIAANMRMLGAPAPVALAVQAGVAAAVALVVWRAFRAGVSPRASALLVVGTFLATPHAFNYDMPMTTAAVIWFIDERVRATQSLAASELVILAAAMILPFAMLAFGAGAPAFSWAPLALLFLLIARPNPAIAGSAPSRPAPFGAPTPLAAG
jgi:hypothetical protein